MGCTKGFIYHYHATKTDLFFDVHREGMRRLFAAVEPAMASAGDALAVLRAGFLGQHAARAVTLLSSVWFALWISG